MIANGIMVNTARKTQNTTGESSLSSHRTWLPMAGISETWPVCAASVITVSRNAAPNDSPSAHSNTRDCCLACALSARRYLTSCAVTPAIGVSRPKNSTKLIVCGASAVDTLSSAVAPATLVASSTRTGQLRRPPQSRVPVGNSSSANT